MKRDNHQIKKTWEKPVFEKLDFKNTLNGQTRYTAEVGFYMS